jgi:hypothetical protein
MGVALEVWEPVSLGLVVYTGQWCCLYLDGGQYLLWSVLCWFCIVVSFFNKCVYDF